MSVRKAITALQAAGYRPDAMLLTPAAAEPLEGLVTRLRPTGLRLRSRAVLRAIFGQTKRVSKAIAAPAVLDSRLLGRLYSSRVSLARFEENAGRTNTSLIRLEAHAAFGTERHAAAVRIAAS